MVLTLGVARRDVSPVHAVELAGFGRRGNALISRIAHPIQLRVAVVGDGSRDLALVSGEFLNWSTERDATVRSIVAASAGVAESDVMFCATHTHSAPQLSHDHAALLGVADQAYVAELDAHLARVSQDAAAARCEVAVSRTTGTYELARQRREHLDAERPIDDRLTVVRFQAGDVLVACFVHYTCHPVVSADDAVSGDFLGVAMGRVEDATGAIVFPLQGCAGDVDPVGVVMTGIERAESVGRDFADAVVALLKGPAEPVVTAPTGSTWTSAELPLVGSPTESELVAASIGDGLDAQWARALLADRELLRPFRECRLQLWSLGPGLQLLGINGEATSPYGLRIRAESGGSALPVAYSNGMIGYLPTAAQIAAGGYEVEESARCYLLPGTFDPVIEQRIDDAVDRLLHSDRRN